MVQKIEATDVTEEEALNAAFFERADEFIQQANEFCRVEKGSQEKPSDKRGQVSAAMLFGTARFNTWVAANNFKDGNEMRDAKDQVMSYILQQFQMMLEDNYDECLNSALISGCFCRCGGNFNKGEPAFSSCGIRLSARASRSRVEPSC
jgi:hypothetical protein